MQIYFADNTDIWWQAATVHCKTLQTDGQCKSIWDGHQQQQQQSLQNLGSSTLKTEHTNHQTMVSLPTEHQFSSRQYNVKQYYHTQYIMLQEDNRTVA